MAEGIILGPMSELPEKIGRYEILSIVGRGAMGIVYKARDPLICRVVALKQVALPEGFSEGQRSEYSQRFFHEARAAGNLHHPNIVTVYDVGEEGGAPFMAQEFVEGESLGDLLKRRSTLPPEEALGITRQVALGLAYAHGHGVVHRDIKPDNILVDHTGRVVITDFGVAHLDSSELTRTGEILGTPHFMSPEQVTGQPLDGRSDLFSLGVVLFLMLTGKRPFVGDTISTVCYHIVHSPPQPEIGPAALPQEISEVLSRLLCKSREGRFAGGDDLVHAIDEALGHLRGEATLPVVSDLTSKKSSAAGNDETPTVMVPPGGTVEPPPPSAPQPPQRKVLNRVTYGVLGILVIIVILGGIVRLAGHFSREAVPADSVAPPSAAPQPKTVPQGGAPETGLGAEDSSPKAVPPASPADRGERSNKIPAAPPRAPEVGAKRPVGQGIVRMDIFGPIRAGGLGIQVDGEMVIKREIHGGINPVNPSKAGFRISERLNLRVGPHTLRFGVRPAVAGSSIMVQDHAVNLKSGEDLHLWVSVHPRKGRIIVTEGPNPPSQGE